jgi:hypothetical protein
MVFLKKLTLFTLPLLLSACGNDDLDPNDIGTPDIYQFASQTDPAATSSVDYREATTRIILIKELQSLINSNYLQEVGVAQGKEAVIALLNRVYSAGTQSISNVNLYNNQSIPTPISGVTNTLDKLQTDFSNLVNPVNLKSTMPGIFANLIYRKDGNSDLGYLIGWSKAGVNDGDELADIMIQDWFGQVAILAADIDPTSKTTRNGINYQTLISNFLNAAIPYYQATRTLLSMSYGLQASNSSQTSYTQLQHNWDLAYGYFGSNSHYKSKGHTINASQSEFDHNGDGKIDLFSEMNFNHSIDAASLDARSPLTDTNFSEAIVQAFLDGRQLINNHIDTDIAGNAEFSQALLHEASVITRNWDRVMAAQLIHYLNRAAVSSVHYGPIPALNDIYANDWANVKSYALALQFNPDSLMSKDELIEIHTLIGSFPVVKNDTNKLRTYSNKLLMARDKIGSIYNISEMNLLNW